MLVALGLGVTAWARAHLDRFWSARVTLKADHALSFGPGVLFLAKKRLDGYRR